MDGRMGGWQALASALERRAGGEHGALRALLDQTSLRLEALGRALRAAMATATAFGMAEGTRTVGAAALRSNEATAADDGAAAEAAACAAVVPLQLLIAAGVAHRHVRP
jgi:hypothetical protein